MTEKRIYRFTPEEKESWWGKGEWVDEADLIQFEHMGIECRIVRMAMEEPCAKEFHMSGGFLNGYVAIPGDHPYWGKIYEDLNIECHGGLTFGKCSDRHWIGFDCAHSFDYVPSMEHLKKTAAFMQDVRDNEEKIKKFCPNSPFWVGTYRNIQFCIDQCKYMAEQLVDIAKGNKE